MSRIADAATLILLFYYSLKSNVLKNINARRKLRIGLDAYFRKFRYKLKVLIKIHMHVFSNLVANLLAAVMSLWAFQAAVTKEKIAHP